VAASLAPAIVPFELADMLVSEAVTEKYYFDPQMRFSPQLRSDLQPRSYQLDIDLRLSPPIHNEEIVDNLRTPC
jgi:hypothetical protein